MKLIKYFILLLVLIPTPVWAAASVTWTCDRCTPSSGTAVGTSKWSIANIGLKVGVNVITVIADDGLGNAASQIITVTYAPTFPGPALIGAWGLEEGTGTTTADQTANSLTATLTNGATWMTGSGRYGTGISLNPAASQYLNVPDTSPLGPLDLTQSFTFSLWLRPAAFHNDFQAALIKDYNIALYSSNNGAYCAIGAPLIWFQANGLSGPSFYACDSTALPNGIWTHLAATYDGANLKLYRNGVLVPNSGLSIGTKAVSPQAYIEPSNGPLRIGSSQSFGEYFDGMVDEIRVYNYAIPVTAGGNSLGAPCATSGGVQTNLATPSIVGDMNCQIVTTTPPAPTKFEIGAGSTFSIGAGSTFAIGPQ